MSSLAERRKHHGFCPANDSGHEVSILFIIISSSLVSTNILPCQRPGAFNLKDQIQQIPPIQDVFGLRCKEGKALRCLMAREWHFLQLQYQEWSSEEVLETQPVQQTQGGNRIVESSNRKRTEITGPTTRSWAILGPVDHHLLRACTSWVLCQHYRKALWVQYTNQMTWETSITTHNCTCRMGPSLAWGHLW